MRIRTIKTTNTMQYAIIKDVNKNGKRTTCIYENLGTLDKIKLRTGNEEPLVWLNNYVKELNEKSKEEKITTDFECAEFVVCTDAGLASKANRKFNDKNNKKF